MRGRTQKILVGAIVVVAIIFLAAVGFFLAGHAQNIFDRGPELSLPILILTGVMVLLVTLSLTAVVFASMDISDKSQALALPEGSVRAVIALSLVMLFAIVSIFLYSNLSSSGKIEIVSGLTKPERDQFVSRVPTNLVLLEQAEGTPEKQTYTIHYRVVLNPASEDFAKQLLVLIGTLVTAVASFYFGSKTATAAQFVAADSFKTGAPAVHGIDPTKLVRGAPPISMVISGDNLDLAKEVKAVLGAAQALATNVMSNASTIKCGLALDQNAPTGAWDIIITDNVGRQAKLAACLSVV